MSLVELGSILVLEKGRKPSTQSNINNDGFSPYVDIEAFETGIVKHYTNDEKCLPCDDGDILIVCDGSRSGLVGKAIKGYVGSTLARIRAAGLYNDYLFYYVQWKYALLNTKKKGTGTPHLNVELLKKQMLRIPDFPEQKRIVARIEELFSQLDAGVETLKKTKQQLEVYRRSLLNTAFLGDFPMRKLSDISRAFGGYAFKSKKYTENGKYIVVKIGNVKSQRFDFSRDRTRTDEVSDDILKRYLLSPGDCVITLTGSRGKRDYGYVAMITDEEDFLLNQRVAALRFDRSVAFPKFYLYYLSSPAFREQFFAYETGNVGQGNVGMKALTEPKVVCPTLEEQIKIVCDLENRLSVCDSIERTVDLSLQQAESMRQSVLKQAFEGSI